MIIGVPKEIKNHEYRVGLVPAGAHALVAAGHTVFIEEGTGLGSGITDDEYLAAGADILPSAKDVFDRADMIIKVKEPLPQEYPLLRENQILYTYLHLAPAQQLTEALLDRKIIGVAYETIQLADGSLPLLTPMSEVAGRMATQVGAYYLGKSHGGRGVLLGGVPGVHRGRITIIGGGVVGINAAKIAVGLGAQVTILDVNQGRLAYLDDIFGNGITTLMSNKHTMAEVVANSNLVVGAVLIPGAKAPHLVTREMIASMLPGSVIVDVAIDQGGCIETSHATTHDDPVFVVDDVIHYCVANMPGEFARTSTFALTNVTLPYALALANNGVKQAIENDACLRKGVNVCKGHITCAPVADAMNKPYTNVMTLV
ncbi:alanine dehydrogenase [Desulfovibrio inopinatus]|uniref:alanine dehydrogenase n=1 Tax=Desulfovibrio inopinatus TaxID=102109 RepID=UPI000424E202|nr:alanine dehydrogenase [Desulfovibrio inopinatus]